MQQLFLHFSLGFTYMAFDKSNVLRIHSLDRIHSFLKEQRKSS